MNGAKHDTILPLAGMQKELGDLARDLDLKEVQQQEEPRQCDADADACTVQVQTGTLSRNKQKRRSALSYADVALRRHVVADGVQAITTKPHSNGLAQTQKPPQLEDFPQLPEPQVVPTSVKITASATTTSCQSPSTSRQPSVMKISFHHHEEEIPSGRVMVVGQRKQRQPRKRLINPDFVHLWPQQSPCPPIFADPPIPLRLHRPPLETFVHLWPPQCVYSTPPTFAYPPLPASLIAQLHI